MELTLVWDVTRWTSLWKPVEARSPRLRNNRWLAANPWFEADVLPALRARVDERIATP